MSKTARNTVLIAAWTLNDDTGVDPPHKVWGATKEDSLCLCHQCFNPRPRVGSDYATQLNLQSADAHR
jgi:hypothetical protein